MSSLTSTGATSGETRLPYAVDGARLQVAHGELWSVRLREPDPSAAQRGSIGAVLASS
jgi:hypothetical protein